MYNNTYQKIRVCPRKMNMTTRRLPLFGGLCEVLQLLIWGCTFTTLKLTLTSSDYSETPESLEPDIIDAQS